MQVDYVGIKSNSSCMHIDNPLLIQQKSNNIVNKLYYNLK